MTATFTDPNPALTVTKAGSPARKAGTGAGTVTSAPAGINCGADCTEEYATGTVVTLTADPAAGSTFDGFTGGGCSGTATTCMVTVDEATTVTAIFSGPVLTVTKAGAARARSVRSCEHPARHRLRHRLLGGLRGEHVVVLTAASNANTVAGGFGVAFAGFTGCDSSTATTCTVTMDRAKNVTATFIDFPTLTVAKAGTGTGTVTSNPAGLNCGATCMRDFPKDSSVVLTAAATGGTFTGFTGGGCSGTATTCSVTLDQAKTVTATFAATPRALTVTKAGGGSGTVTSSPGGVDCGADCTQQYENNTAVTLTADPAAGSTFTGFTGAGCSGAGTTCVVTMDQAQTVTATFALIPRALTVTKAGAGSGTVTSTPGGIACGADCAQDYDHGTAVTLTAAAAAGSSFTGFTGAGCSGAGTTCVVTMDQARTATATFALLPRTLTVTKAGAGSGTVTSSPSGITCAPDCTQAYDNGTPVTLTADPASGSTFAGFTGAGCSGAGTTCVVTMDDARSVTATFGLTPPPPPPPPPPPAVVPPPPPPPPPAAPPARRSGSLSASVTPSRDLRAPFSFRTTGRLTRPSGITQAAGCNGRVSIQVKRGNTTISTRRVTLSSTCTFSSRVSFSSRSRFGSATRLKFTARFLGNALILPDAAPSRFARIRG